MAFEITAQEGSLLYQAAALRGPSESEYHTKDALELAQESADMYSRIINEMTYMLLVALGKVKPGEDGEGDPLALVQEAAAELAKPRAMCTCPCTSCVLGCTG